ncbi:unnamed protein product [Paramecium primaurelia]|uniref:Uncharacterized protein n=1 Tax=Paramecium primaurelia TaxID=5886 RepID=A0A8S1MUA0_PARPR|nr:unnamed protein product [Paramecium primaurelia]
MVSHASNVNCQVQILQIQQIIVLLVKIKQINKLSLVNVKYDNNNRCLTCLDTNYELYNISQCVCNPLIIQIVSLHLQSVKNHVMNGFINCIDINQILVLNKCCICKSGYLQQSDQYLQCQIPCSTCINTLNECVTCVDPNQIINHRLQMFMQRRACEYYFQGIYNCNNCIKDSICPMLINVQKY